MDHIAATRLVESAAALAFWGLAASIVGAGECEVTRVGHCFVPAYATAQGTSVEHSGRRPRRDSDDIR